MQIFLNSADDLAVKGYQECQSAPANEPITKNNIKYNLAGKYSVKVEGKEKVLLIVKAALLILITLGFALCSSSVKANLQGRRVDVVYIKEQQSEESSLKTHTKTQTDKTPPKTFIKTKTEEKSTSPFTDYRSPEAYKWRAKVFEETLIACEKGYVNKHGAAVKINHKPMLQETMTFHALPELPPAKELHQTQFSVFTQDTFNVLLMRRRQGANPVGVNMAHRAHAGGGAKDGCPAQEESLSRRSNLVLGLKTQKYPLHEFGGIYCPHIQVFKEDEIHGCAYMDSPEEVALVAMAFYDLRSGSQDRKDLELPLTGPISNKDLLKSDFIKGTRYKIRNMLRIMAEKGHKELVLGAFGCGAFKNPPRLISRLFLEVFNEAEFKGRFKSVDFAILKIFEDDQENVDSFNDICKELNTDS